MTLAKKDVQSTNSEPNIDQQREYWKHWQDSRSESQWALERVEVALDLIKGLSLERPKILDLGCGTGWFTEKLAALGPATGMDLNEEAMQEARNRWPHISFIGGNIFEYPFDANSFDIVVSMQVIAHVENQSDLIERVTGLLKPGGYLLISTNNRFVMDRLGSIDWGSHHSAGHIEKWLAVKDLKRLVSTQLDVLQIKTLLPMGNGGMLRFINSVKLNNLLDRMLPRGYMRRLKERLGLGYYILLLAQKPADKGG